MKNPPLHNACRLFGVVAASTLLAVGPDLHAGDLDVIGNLDVASNLTAGTVTLSGQSRSNWPSSLISSLSNDVGYVQSGGNLSVLSNNVGYLTLGGANYGNVSVVGSVTISSNLSASTLTVGGITWTNLLSNLSGLSNDVGYIKTGGLLSLLSNDVGYAIIGTNTGNLTMIGNVTITSNLTASSVSLGGQTRTNWPSNLLSSLSNDVGYVTNGANLSAFSNNVGYLSLGSTNVGNLNLSGNLNVLSNFTSPTITIGGQSRTNWPNGTISLRLYGRSGLIPSGSTALPVAPYGNYIQFSATTDRITYEVPMPPQFSPGTAVTLVYHLVSCDATSASGSQLITVLTPSQVTNWPPSSANFDAAANSQSITFSTSGVISQQINATVTGSTIFSSAAPSGIVAVQIKPSSTRLHWFGVLEIDQAQ